MPQTLADRIAALIAEAETEMARILAVKPAAADGRSDGRRVRYVRAETAATTLREILDFLR